MSTYYPVTSTDSGMRLRIHWWLLLRALLLSLFTQLHLHFVQFFKQLLIFLLQLLVQLSNSVILFLAFIKPLRSLLGNLADFPFQLVNLLPLTFCSRAYHL